MIGRGERVEVVGIGRTGPVLEDARSIPEMVLASVHACLLDAGRSYADIDAVVTASVDLVDGLTASNVAVTEVVGAVMKPETRIACDGLAAVLHAACQIWAGAYETVLVVAHGKASMSPRGIVGNWALDPIFVQPLGLDFLACAGLQARTLHRGADTDRSWARTVAMRRASAGATRLPGANTEDEVLASPMVASPLREGMCAPEGDGAVSVLLQRADSTSTTPQIAIVGIGHDLDEHSLGARDLGAWRGLSRACARAYAMADISVPSRAFDLAEPSCRHPHEEDLFLRGSGLSVNLRMSSVGGAFGGHAPMTSGLSRLVDAVVSMRSDPAIQRALVHGAWGPAGQGQVVAVAEAFA